MKTLTPKQQATLKKLALGKNRKEIAWEEGITPEAIDDRCMLIARKLKTSSIALWTQFALASFLIKNKFDIVK